MSRGHDATDVVRFIAFVVALDCNIRSDRRGPSIATASCQRNIDEEKPARLTPSQRRVKRASFRMRSTVEIILAQQKYVRGLFARTTGLAEDGTKTEVA